MDTLVSVCFPLPFLLDVPSPFCARSTSAVKISSPFVRVRPAHASMCSFGRLRRHTSPVCTSELQSFHGSGLQSFFDFRNFVRWQNQYHHDPFSSTVLTSSVAVDSSRIREIIALRFSSVARPFDSAPLPFSSFSQLHLQHLHVFAQQVDPWKTALSSTSIFSPHHKSVHPFNLPHAPVTAE